MKTKLWVSIVATASIIAYMVGFAVSKHTGVEPGFFELAESGGYGVSGDTASSADVDPNMKNYYDQLSD